MKYVLPILFIVICGTVKAQYVLTGCYDFSKGVKIKNTSENGLFRTSADYLAGTVENVEKISRNTNGLQIREDGKSKLHKYEDLASEYWGFVNASSIFRLSSTKVDGFEVRGFNYVEKPLQVYGKLCLYGMASISDPVQNSNGGFNYTYTYMNYSLSISLGLDGELMDLTNYHFSQLLEQIDPELNKDYLNEFEQLSGVKLHTDASYNTETMKLFYKYFEIVNNSEAENK